MPDDAAAQPSFTVSVSQVQDFRTCQQLWYYKSILKVIRQTHGPQLDLGSWLHEYWQRYYKALRDGAAPNPAHMDALRTVYARAKDASYELAATASLLDETQAAEEYLDLPEKFRRLAVGYYRVRGKVDPQLHDILLIEAPIPARLTPEIGHVGYVDLVTRNRHTDRVCLWEHKSHRRIPTDGARSRNIQVAIYTHFVEQVYDLRPTAVLWNYTSTTEPETPRVLKSGEGLSRAQIRTTWDVYKAKLDEYQYDPKEYVEVQLSLAGKETTQFYPRYELPPASGGTNVLLRDYAQTAQDMLVAKREWESTRTAPVRTITSGCDYCAYNRLCDAAVITGEEPEPQQYGYSTRPAREEIA